MVFTSLGRNRENDSGKKKKPGIVEKSNVDRRGKKRVLPK
jgi:hypothetical protein